MKWCLQLSMVYNNLLFGITMNTKLLMYLLQFNVLIIFLGNQVVPS